MARLIPPWSSPHSKKAGSCRAVRPVVGHPDPEPVAPLAEPQDLHGLALSLQILPPRARRPCGSRAPLGRFHPLRPSSAASCSALILSTPGPTDPGEVADPNGKTAASKEQPPERKAQESIRTPQESHAIGPCKGFSSASSHNRPFPPRRSIRDHEPNLQAGSACSGSGGGYGNAIGEVRRSRAIVEGKTRVGAERR
jgi:hypothetical protein